MTDRTAAARNARMRARKRAAGMVPVTVIVPENRKAELAAIVRRWVAEETNANVAGLDAGNQ